jgi:hypothetical protein
MSPPDPEPTRRTGRLLWIPAALVGAVALALLVALGSLHHLQQATELALARRELQMAAIERRSLEIELESERLITREELAVALQHRDQTAVRDPLSDLLIRTLHPPVAGNPNVAVVVWHPRNRQGVLLVDGLPPDAAGHSYQLWHDGVAVEGTRFVANGSGTPLRLEFTGTFKVDATWELRAVLDRDSATDSIVLTSR